MAQEDKKQNVDIFALIQQQFEQLRNVDEKQQSNNFLPSSDGSNAENWPEQTLVCCGSSNSGKSSLISLFLSAFSARHISSAVPSSAIDQKTIALEFRFGTRIWGENNKQLVNVWELAGGGTMAPLVQIPLQKRNIRATSLLLFLDLTRPKLLQSVAETLMTACRKRIESLLADNETPQAAIGRNELQDKHAAIRPIGIPFAIVCARYDEFQNLNSEQKRQTYRLIRQFAHINGAAIITLSIRMDSLLTKARTFLTNLVNAPPLQQIQKSLSTDPQQPLFVVPHGTDSFEDINPSLRSLNSFSEAMLNFLQSLNQTFAQQQQTSAAVQDDEANDGTEEGEEMKQQLAEPEIDALVEERTRLLELFAREKRDRREAEKRAADRRQ